MDTDHAFGSEKDLRHELRSTRRHEKQKQKYYGYRGVKRSWPGQPAYKPPEEAKGALRSQGQPWLTFPTASIDDSDLEVATWTKKDQYDHREFDIWPLDRKHHVGRRERRNCDYVPSRWAYERKAKTKNEALDDQIEDVVAVSPDLECLPDKKAIVHRSEQQQGLNRSAASEESVGPQLSGTLPTNAPVEDNEASWTIVDSCEEREQTDSHDAWILV